MKNVEKLFICVVFLLGALLCGKEVFSATGEVTRSGSTWTARVDGNTVYTGSRMFDAVNAACSNAGSGTINGGSPGEKLSNARPTPDCFVPTNSISI